MHIFVSVLCQNFIWRPYKTPYFRSLRHMVWTSRWSIRVPWRELSPAPIYWGGSCSPRLPEHRFLNLFKRYLQSLQWKKKELRQQLPYKTHCCRDPFNVYVNLNCRSSIMSILKISLWKCMHKALKLRNIEFMRKTGRLLCGESYLLLYLDTWVTTLTSQHRHVYHWLLETSRWSDWVPYPVPATLIPS